MPNLLGIDVGTTSMKAVLFDGNGTALKSVSKDYTLITKGDRVELDANKYSDMMFEALAEIRAEYKIDALSIDTQCETLIVTDKNGEPLYNAIVWLDNRAAKEAETIAERFTLKEVFEVTGQPEITATWPASKLLWLRENEPEIFKKTEKIFLLEDYLLYKLTGEFVTEKTLQSSSLYLDIRSGTWWRDMLDFIGVDENRLPRLMNNGEIVGKYEGITVVTGVMDQIAGSIGAGVCDSSVISEMTGTTMAIVVPTESIPEYTEGSKVPCHVNFDGGYCLLTWTPTAGIALKWWKDNFCDGMSFDDLNVLAEKVSPGCDGLAFMPYLCGSVIPDYKPEARGAFMGMTMEHGRGHTVRAIFESVAFMLREHLEYLGVECDEIRSMGGGANSKLWCQIKADVTGKRIVTLESKETACLGSAIMAGVGAGIFENVKDTCKRLIKTKNEYLPSGVNYDAAYERYNNYKELILK